MPYNSPDKLKAYQARIREREKIRLARAYQDRRELLLERRKARYQATKTVELARNRAWSLRNKERHRALCRSWSKKNPIAARALVARRRARLKGAEGFYTTADVRTLLEAQKGLCNHCNRDLSSRYDVDHIVPILKGGSNWPSNLQLLCPPCNRSKSCKTPEEWRIVQSKQVSG